MRILLALVLVAACLWGGYWFVGSRALERGAEAWFEQQQAAGRIAERESIVVRGFPNRFDLTVEGLSLEDPATGFRWQAPFVQVLSLTYKPWHVIALMPPSQLITYRGQEIEIGAGRLRGSLIVSPTPALALDRLAISGEQLEVRTFGTVIRAENARLASRRDDEHGLRHELGLDVTALATEGPLVVAAAEAGLPPAIGKITASVFADVTAPLDRHAAETRPQLTKLDLAEARIEWGELKLFAEGGVTVDPAGVPEGRIDFRLENWRMALDLAVKLGAVDAEVAQTYGRMLSLLAAASPDPDNLDVPLVFANGRMSLGPLPLGPAPLLGQRQ